METMLLREPEVLPTKEVLERVLGERFSVLNELVDIISKPENGLVLDWRYYKDGKAWLCKASYKKKTVFWLSVWDGFFKINFYFNQKNYLGVLDLELAEEIKNDFIKKVDHAKFIPLSMNVSEKDQIRDILKIINYKKNLK
jgi:hypothetical protein